ncbi:MAG TPA: TetR/AcrR family transcriptional regulator [Spirochaetota bacterium]|nr:TetR/AcrR family transcriptional regulator [Spirochaetota bacterium]HPJ36476.1 TetR/AcrR family transcriptional regulator [Spirochaetota bacterium]
MAKTIKESDETKIKILTAAKKEFANKGFNGARMSSIAAIAGVNQALLHYHFENKENLYRSIFQTAIGDIATEFSERLASEVDQWNVRLDIQLCAAIYTMIAISMDSHDDDLHRIFAREMAEGQGLLHEYVKRYMMPRLILFENIIKEGVETGIFETSNTMLFSMNVVAFILNFSHWEDFFTDTPLHKSLYGNKKETLYNYMIEMAFKSLRPKGKELKIPVLDKEKKDRINHIVNEIYGTLMF